MDPDLLSQFCEAMPVPVMVVNVSSRVVAANSAARVLVGPEATDRPFVTVLRNPPVNAALDEVLAGGAGARLTAQLKVRGREVGSVVSVMPLVLADWRGATVVIEDSSGVEQAEQMRRDFVANVSHELRTPLTALIGFIETLRGPARNDAAARDRFLTIMDREAGRMNRLIGDLLSLSRVESEERRRPSEIVDLAGLVRSAVTTLSQTAKASGVRLVLAGVDLPVRVPGDPDQIVQVFHNLIENAIKYGGGGEVRVTVTRIPHEPLLRGPGWSVEVADDGDGIDPLHLPRLTERFYRVDNHRSREKGGTGLGLAIVKHIVARHRGRMRIESERGFGSRFTVILPEQIEGR